MMTSGRLEMMMTMMMMISPHEADRQEGKQDRSSLGNRVLYESMRINRPSIGKKNEQGRDSKR